MADDLVPTPMNTAPGRLYEAVFGPVAYNACSLVLAGPPPLDQRCPTFSPAVVPPFAASGVTVAIWVVPPQVISAFWNSISAAFRVSAGLCGGVNGTTRLRSPS